MLATYWIAKAHGAFVEFPVFRPVACPFPDRLETDVFLLGVAMKVGATIRAAGLSESQSHLAGAGRTLPEASVKLQQVGAIEAVAVVATKLADALKTSIKQSVLGRTGAAWPG